MNMMTLRILLALLIPFRWQAAQIVKPSFEVASIKRNVSQSEGGSAGPRGDRFIATNVTLTMLVNYAFGPSRGPFLDRQIIGGPDWMRTDRFDIQAKAPEAAASIPAEQMRLMLQSLLEDRFQLKVHREVQDLTVYDLVVAKGGLKMKLSSDQTPPPFSSGFISFRTGDQEDPAPLPRGSMRLTKGSAETTLSGNAVQMSNIVNLLQRSSDRV